MFDAVVLDVMCRAAVGPAISDRLGAPTAWDAFFDTDAGIRSMTCVRGSTPGQTTPPQAFAFAELVATAPSLLRRQSGANR